MPQMAPMMWLILFVYFVLLLMFYVVMIYFMYVSSVLKLESSVSSGVKSLIWLW